MTHASGAAFGYSNADYIVAGLLVEAVAGQPFAEELQRRLIGHEVLAPEEPCDWMLPEGHDFAVRPRRRRAVTIETALSMLAVSASFAMNERTVEVIPVLIGLFVLFDVIGVVVIFLTVRRRKGPEN